MKQFFGMSQRGDLREAVRGLNRPQLIMLMSNSQQFESHVKELEELYPGVPSIGCIGMCYDTRIVEKGVGVIAFSNGVRAAANVLEEVTVMPVKYIATRSVRILIGMEQAITRVDFTLFKNTRRIIIASTAPYRRFCSTEFTTRSI